MKQTMYGILHLPTKKLLGFSTLSNCDADCCVDTQFELNLYSDNVWLVESREKAEKARIKNTPWYNAGYSTPTNEFVPNELKIVEVILEIK